MAKFKHIVQNDARHVNAKSSKMNKMPISAEQSRAARGLLGWSQADLAAAAKVARGSVISFEKGNGGLKDRTIFDLRRALEDSGVCFVDDDGGVGVMLPRK